MTNKEHILDLQNLSAANTIRLNQLKREIKQDFNLFIAEIYTNTDLSINWHVNSVLSRHHSSSQVFGNILMIALVKELVQKKTYDTLVVSNTELKSVFKKYFKEDKIKIEVRFVISLRNRIKQMLRLPLCFINNVILTLNYWANKSISRNKLIKRKKNLTLLDIYLEDVMISNEGFKDRYYTGMLKYLKEDERSSIYYVPMFVNSKDLRETVQVLETFKENFLYKFDFLKFSDYLFALLNPFNTRKLNFKKYSFHGINVGAVIKKDFFSNLATRGTFEALLNYRFFKRLKEHKINLRLVVNWFENQNTDRGFIKGVHDFYTEIKCVGYQGFFTSSDYFNHLIPVSHELKYKVIPDEIAIIGKGLLNNYPEIPDSMLKVAPGFRVSEVYKNNYPILAAKKILVVLPSSQRVSIEILEMIIKVYKHFEDKGVLFQIRPHPDLNTNLIQSILDPISKNFEFVISGKLSDLIGQTGLVISNASSASMEALSYGVPVIIVSGKHELTYNPISDNIPKEIWAISNTSAELEKQINDFLYVSEKELSIRHEIAEYVKNQFFEPVSEAGVRHFLKLK